MAHFTNDKLGQLAAARGVRASYVREAQRAATDNVYMLEHIIKRALPLAREEAQEFADAFREPMPGHVGRTLDAEVSMWERLADGLATLRERAVTSEELDAYSCRVRSYLSWQYDLVLLEQEMVTSCLVQHYDEMRERILAAAADSDITNI
jgi:hypothetical protein